MKSLDIALVRTLQFLVMLFFTCVVFLWYGCAALIPLAIWYNVVQFLSGPIGPVISMIMSFVIIASIGVYLFKIPKLLETFIATGADLMKMGYASVRRMGDIAASVKNDAVPQDQRMEIHLKDKLS